MTYERPVSILGGLAVIARVSFGKDADTPNGPGEYWGEVCALYWIKRDGSKGHPLSLKVFDRAMAYAYSGVDIIDQVGEAIAYEDHEERHGHSAAFGANHGVTFSEPADV